MCSYVHDLNRLAQLIKSVTGIYYIVEHKTNYPSQHCPTMFKVRAKIRFEFFFKSVFK